MSLKHDDTTTRRREHEATKSRRTTKAWGLSCFILLAGIVIVAMGRSARGEELNLGLPGDCLAFVELDPGAGAGKVGGGSALLDVGLEAMQSFGVLPKEAAVVGDALGVASVAGSRRSCLALLDADLSVVGESGLG